MMINEMFDSIINFFTNPNYCPLTDDLNKKINPLNS